MTTDAEPPPSYSPDPADDETRSDGTGAVVEPQIIIIPTGNDGELQLKCADGFRWERCTTMSLRSVEVAYETEIELGDTEVVLCSSSSEDRRASFPFAIPLTTDTAQCIHSLRSSLSHTLTANVYAAGGVRPRLRSRCWSTPAGIRRTRTSRSLRGEGAAAADDVQGGEPIPVYLTVPVPERELVVERGLRLRNVRAELVRSVRVRTSTETTHPAGEPSSSTQPSDAKTVPAVPGEQKVIALSGAACRLHPARPLNIRLILHPPVGSPLAMQTRDLPAEDYYAPDTVECAAITQTTLLHSVSFRLRVHVAFMNMASHTERVSTLEFPIVLLPPTAALPQVEESMDTAYHKKHDRPPARTNRIEDNDVPRYEEGEAGPSYHSAPPPFEEREAPPPFFSAPQASTRPDDGPPPMAQPNAVTDGEGVLFGFPPSEHFDGYADMDHGLAGYDVTPLASMNPTAAIEAMGLALGLDRPDNPLAEPPPPPPPPMDDPSDPPPSIDSDFRDPEGTHQSPRSHPPRA
ncbi:uncharacterized protein B0H18DRAFT_1152375 [Fomitopsis serialis]|uniref:uncharacterized protein n=1 Tax=Fomitopsis serialis TaxID=139415 RepID=UPI00200822A7|nr:uncharacterized protein B0H18DRAFT_1152375 [Neoantrodia serialis]KAH9937575.1 hypothetical protein B0H18DRAFT_1152375 [Neoantrodia serialis]